MKRMTAIPAGALAMALALASGVPVQAQDVAAAIASDVRTDADRGQDEARMPAEILQFADIAGGAVVADFMAGGGYFTALLGEVVGDEGRVYAVNPAGFHQAEVWEARLQAQDNLSVMPVAPRAMLLAPSSVDHIFTHMVFHDLYWESEQFNFPRLNPPAILANWHAALKPGGTVIVVDHVGPPGDVRETTEALHRIDPANVLSAMTKAGFVLAEQSDALRRADDDLTKNVFDPAVQGKTDRIVMKFKKAG